MSAPQILALFGATNRGGIPVAGTCFGPVKCDTACRVDMPESGSLNFIGGRAVGLRSSRLCRLGSPDGRPAEFTSVRYLKLLIYGGSPYPECDAIFRAQPIMMALHRSGLLATLLSVAAMPAMAATQGFSLKVSTAGALGGTFDAPGFTLTNLSDPGLNISSILFSIGNTAYNFDSVTQLGAPVGGTATRTVGDAANGGARTDTFSIAFTSFDPSEVATWRAEIDPDSFNQVADFRKVFFNNGGSTISNSVATVMFSNARTLEVTLSGSLTGTTYTFFASEESLTAIPVPATLPLLAGALGLLGLIRRRATA